MKRTTKLMSSCVEGGRESFVEGGRESFVETQSKKCVCACCSDVTILVVFSISCRLFLLV